MISINRKNPTAGEITSSLTGSNDAPGLHLDGVSSRVEFTPADLGTKFSFEFIVQADAWSAQQFLVDFGTVGRFVLAGLTADSMNLSIFDGTSWKSLGVKVLDDLKVHHLTLTVDGTAAVLYDNANQVGTATISAAHAIDSTTVARLGCEYNANSNEFVGTFYRCRFWNKTLTAAEVTASYENATVPFADQWGSPTSIVAGWDFTSGWSIGSGTIDDLNSFTSSGISGVVKNYSLTIGDVYTVTIAGSTTASGFNFTNSSGAGTGLIGGFGTHVFTAVNASIYLRNSGTGTTDITTLELHKAGVVSDYDLAFANPTQSLLVQDRAGNADGTASATGVAQVTPIEQLNAKAIAVGSSPQTPADNSLIVTGSLCTTQINSAGHIRVEGTDAGAGGSSIISATAIPGNANGPILELAKSRNSAGIVASDDLGQIDFKGHNGSSYQIASQIVATAQGTFSGTSLPSQLDFYTTAASSTTPASRLTIDSAGNVGIGGADPDYRLHCSGSLSVAGTDEDVCRIEGSDTSNAGGITINATYGNTAADRPTQICSIDGQGQASPLELGSGTTTALTIDSAGDVLIGDGSADIVGYNRALTVATHTAGQISAIELVSHQNGDADLSGVEFVNDTTRVASIFASRSGADNSGKLSLATVNAGVFSAKMTIDPAGNAGLGIAPETWQSTRTAFQIGGNGSLNATAAQAAGGHFDLAQNAYINSSGSWSYISTDEASLYNQVGGQHTFKVAASGTADAAITWTDAVKITNTGGIYEGGGSLKENLLTNSGFDVWSNSTLCSSVTGAAPAAADAGDLVNDATAGSGTAWTGATGATPPNGWSATWAGLFAIDGSSGSGAEPALKITVDSTPTENPGIVDSWTVVVGKLYQFSFRFKKGASATGGIVYLGTSSGGTQYNRWDPTSGTWATYTHVFEATTATVHAGLRCDSAIDGQHCWYDSVMLHEVTPGCVAANTLGPDGWRKDGTGNIDVLREHNGTNTKEGSFYSAKVVSTAASNFEVNNYTEPTWAEKFAGRTITFGFWAKTSTASLVRAYIWDGSTATFSPVYHTGGGGWEWLEATATVSASATRLEALINMAIAGTAYISQPMLVFGSAIGEGNYSRPSGEIVICEGMVRIQNGVSPVAADDKILNLEAMSSGKIPKGCKAINIAGQIENSAVTTYDGVTWMATSSSPYEVRAYPLVANFGETFNGLVTCDSNGDIYQLVTEPDATLSGLYQDVTAIHLR